VSTCRVADKSSLHIDQYRFGHIDIEGRGYNADVIILSALF
jgi:hypothetical protein